MNKMKRILGNCLKALVLPAAIYLLLFLIARAVGRSFGSWTQLKSIIMQTARPLLITYGVCFAMKSGRMDFASGALTTFAGMFAALVVSEWMGLGDLPGLIAFCAICVLVGMVLGVVNGVLYITMRVPGLVGSLGLCMVYETLCYCLTNGGSMTLRGSTMMYFGRTPGLYYMMIFGAILFYLIWSKTSIGYHVRAVGMGQIMARNVGVKVEKLSVIAFVCSGLFYGLGGIVYQSFSGTLYPTTNFGTAALMFDGVVALIVADFLSRYCNMAIACFLASLTFKMLTAGLVTIGLQSEYQEIFRGAFIILFTFFTSQEKWLEQRRHDKKRMVQALAELETQEKTPA